MTRRALLVSSANPYPVVTNGCARLVGDYLAHVFPNDEVSFLHTRSVRWSYGAMKGRPADWAAELVGVPVADLVSRLAAAGFDGVYVDRFGYADDGRNGGLQVVVEVSQQHVQTPRRLCWAVV